MAVDQQLSVDSIAAAPGHESLFETARARPAARPGVIVAGYGEEETFAQIHLDVMNFLAADGVLVANVPTEWKPVTGDSVALTFYLEKIREQGINELLYIVSQEAYGFFRGGQAAIDMQCYAPDGTRSWTAQVARSGSISTGAAIGKVRRRLRQELLARRGQPCFTPGAASSETSVKN